MSSSRSSEPSSSSSSERAPHAEAERRSSGGRGSGERGTQARQADGLARFGGISGQLRACRGALLNNRSISRCPFLIAIWPLALEGSVAFGGGALARLALLEQLQLARTDHWISGHGYALLVEYGLI